MDFTFFIDAPADYVINWLNEFTRSAPYQSFPSQEGRIVIQRAGKTTRGNKTIMSMRGMYIKPSGPDSEQGYHLGNPIEFEIIPLTPSRVEIMAKCSHPALNQYFLNLLIEMNKRWPQTEDLSSKIDQLRKIVEVEFNDIKIAQSAIYKEIKYDQQQSINRIIEAINSGLIKQSKMEETIETIRKALKFIQAEQKGINRDLLSTLDDIQHSLERDLDMSQQLELSLPVIPFLINYKFTIDAGVDIEAVWKDLLDSIDSDH